MKQVLVSSANELYAFDGVDVITGNDELDILNEGAVAVLNDRGELVRSNSVANIKADLLDSKWIQIAVGGSSAKTLRLSAPIPRYGTTVSRADYAAAVAQVMWLGDNGDNAYDVNLPAFVPGDIATVTLVDTTPGYIPEAFTQYQYEVQNGDAQADILNGLIAIINADVDRLATAAGIDVATANAGISFTAVEVGKSFKALPQDLLEDADVLSHENEAGQTAATPATAPYKGIGVDTVVIEEESKWMTQEGKNNAVFMPTDFFSFPASALAGVTYDQWVINFDSIFGNRTSARTKNAIPMKLVLYVNTVNDGAATEINDSLKNIFTVAFAENYTDTVGALPMVPTSSPESGV